MNNIESLCLSESSVDPYQIACRLMAEREIPMHGPIHHYLDGHSWHRPAVGQRLL